MIHGWEEQYNKILAEFGYAKKKDIEAAFMLDTIIGKRGQDTHKKISDTLKKNSVLVIGSGPSLSRVIKKISGNQELEQSTKIVADTAVAPLLVNGIHPDIITTDLDGDLDSLITASNAGAILVVHAHGDNIQKLSIASKFRECLGTTQAEPIGNIKNLGGFTDGDRAVFLAEWYSASKIILLGMDMGHRIGKWSLTKRAERPTKLMKLAKAEELLGWLSTFAKAKLFTISGQHTTGFHRVSLNSLNSVLLMP